LTFVRRDTNTGQFKPGLINVSAGLSGVKETSGWGMRACGDKKFLVIPRLASKGRTRNLGHQSFLSHPNVAQNAPVKDGATAQGETSSSQLALLSSQLYPGYVQRTDAEPGPPVVSLPP